MTFQRETGGASTHEFWERGAVCVRRAVDDYWVGVLRTSLELWLRAGSSVGVRDNEEKGHSGHFFNATYVWPRNTEIERFICSSGVAQLAAYVGHRAFVYSRTNSLSRSRIPRRRRPGIVTALPGQSKEVRFVQFGIALDEVDIQNGGLIYISGSTASTSRWSTGRLRPLIARLTCCVAGQLPPSAIQLTSRGR